MATTAAGHALHLDIMNYLVSMARTVEANARSSPSRLQRVPAAAENLFLLELRITSGERWSLMIMPSVCFGEEACPPRKFARSWPLSKSPTTSNVWGLGHAPPRPDTSLYPRCTPSSPRPNSSRWLRRSRAMIKKGLGALIFKNVVSASEVLESDDLVDRYRDDIFERLLAGMRQRPGDVGPECATRARQPLSRTARRSLHKHRRRHHLLGPPTRCAPWSRRES